MELEKPFIEKQLGKTAGLINFETNICRICIYPHSDLVYIFESNINEMINECTTLNVVKNDNLPRNICKICLENLKTAFTLRKQAEKSHKFFVEHLQPNSSKISKSSKKTKETTKTLNDTSEVLYKVNDVKTETETNNFAEQLAHINYNQDYLIGTFNYSDFDSGYTSEKLQNSQVETEHESKEGDFKYKQQDFRERSSTSSNELRNKTKKLNKNRGSLEKLNDIKIEDERINSAEELEVNYNLDYLIDSFNYSDSDSDEKSQEFEINSSETKHENIEQSIPNINYRERFKCSICQQKLSSNTSLITHMRRHTGEKPYLCHQCGSSFSLRHSLVTHVRRAHTGERFQCDFEGCDKTFLQQYGLKKHKREVHKVRVTRYGSKKMKEFQASKLLLKLD